MSALIDIEITRGDIDTILLIKSRIECALNELSRDDRIGRSLAYDDIVSAEFMLRCLKEKIDERNDF